jgi:hypothetical protein
MKLNIYLIKWLFSFGLFHSINSLPCPNMCNGHGRCDEPGQQCLCFDGYQGGDCSELICPFGFAWADQAIGIDDAHNLAECSNMGNCNREIGVCDCREGFEGKACERKSCPNQCTKNGKCQSMRYYADTKDPGEGTVYSYTNIWDADMLYGCHCDTEYYGPDCSLRYCPRGDDPLTGNTANIRNNPRQFNEVQQIYCKAGQGTFTLTFRGKTTDNIPYNAKPQALLEYLQRLTTVGLVKIDMFGYPGQACTDGGNEWSIEFLNDFGDLPMLVPNQDNLGFADDIFTPELRITERVRGTKENEECSNRGFCDASTGYCTCNDDYDTSDGYSKKGIRGDCGFPTTTIQQCPGVISCSGHGECKGSPTYRCACSEGWKGSDCSDRTCPFGISWFIRPDQNNRAHIFQHTECSDQGICNRETGECRCMDGFTGASCNRMTCPGPTPEEWCNGHGQCVDMATLAEAAIVNGDAADFTYGATPNKPQTWDAHMIYGCLCDALWTGYDCSLRVCPFGDNPSTRSQVDEIQRITCQDDTMDGNIVFSFRQQNTEPLLPTATRADVKAALEALNNIDTVNVDYGTISNIDSLCTPGAVNSFLISFRTEHGDLPALIPQSENIDIILVDEYRKGTKENWECSGCGLCDRNSGNCNCFSGYGSSDGMGNKGIKGDCGFIEPIIKL